MDRDVDLAKRAKIIEWLKTELVDQLSHLLKGMWEGSQYKIVDGLASMVASCYILGRRLGISPRKLDEAVLDKMKQHREEGHQLEEWYGDISALEDHLRKR
ncbi:MULTISPECIES: MazG-like family protein [Paenibacillus]|uniref:MazG-like family protein n=1 Tax=Paenibacillus TaxID=44249 RepID=UPI0022B86AEA|nr:MazG-like family protein [Paenibacillus caseinilyticus]MCZ8524073.1 MazG-like family protein [Paenibacillus caseinilyticus]